MKGYLSNLASRALGRDTGIRPRVASVYEAGTSSSKAPDVSVGSNERTAPANVASATEPNESRRVVAGKATNEARRRSSQPPVKTKREEHDLREEPLLVPEKESPVRTFEQPTALDHGLDFVGSSDMAPHTFTNRNKNVESAVPRSTERSALDHVISAVDRGNETTPSDTVSEERFRETIAESSKARPEKGTQQPAFQQASDATEMPGPRTVNVHIGRVEVRAQFPETVPRRQRSSGSARTVSLEDYLKQGTGGGR